MTHPGNPGNPRILFASAAILLVIFLHSCGCEDTFRQDRLGATSIPTVLGDTVYVLQQPVWTGFSKPSDILVGREPFLYVADAGNNRIAMLDLSGALVGHSRAIKNPVALAQDHRLNLLVCAEFDTVLSGAAATFGAVYRIDLTAAGHDIARAPAVRVYWDPSSPLRRFTGVAALSDNSYYVTRTGPNNASVIDPDDAVLLFNRSDRLEPRVLWPQLGADGTGLTTITTPTSIAGFPKPGTDFIFTQSGAKSLFRAQWITQRTTGDVTQWESWFTPARDGDVDFLRVSLFKRPEDVAIDASGNIYIIDAQSDSLFRFNSSGLLTQAFGGPELMKNPEGVAFFDRTLYIADTGNNRILRFVLSTDIR